MHLKALLAVRGLNSPTGCGKKDLFLFPFFLTGYPLISTMHVSSLQ